MIGIQVGGLSIATSLKMIKSFVKLKQILKSGVTGVHV